MATSSAPLGFNRTGIETARTNADAMLDAIDEFSVGAVLGGKTIALVRDDYARDAEPLGSVPPPTTIGGALKTAAGALLGGEPVRLLDKLGERLAFERTGTRLYEVIRGKVEYEPGFPGGPTLEEVDRILLQEYSHFRLVEEIIRREGGDPTVVTPSANLHATMTAGVLAVVVDPRTSVEQCLEAALLAELVDSEGWETLLEFLLEGDHGDVIEYVRKAIDDEADHLALVRRWLRAAQDRDPEPPDEIVESSVFGL